MPHTLCRLCLNTDRLIHVFDSRLRNAEQLRKNILLSTGIDIQHTDIVSKYVCHNCCIIAIKLFKYRKTAIANDKALKDWIGGHKESPPSSTEDILKVQNSVLKSVSQVQNPNVSTSELPNSNLNNSPKTCTIEEKAAVHWTIIELFKSQPNIVVPNDVLKANIKPMLALEKIDPTEFINKTPVANHKTEEKISDFELFRRKFPTINIVKVTKSQNETRRSSTSSISKLDVASKSPDTEFTAPIKCEASVNNKGPSNSSNYEGYSYTGRAAEADDSDGGSINAADDYAPSRASSECLDDITSTSKTCIKVEAPDDNSNNLAEENTMSRLEGSEISLAKKKIFAKEDDSYNSVENIGAKYLSSESSETFPARKSRLLAVDDDSGPHQSVQDIIRSRSNSEHSEIIATGKKRAIIRDDSDGDGNDENCPSRSSSVRSEVAPARKKRQFTTDDDSDGDSYKAVGSKRRKRIISERPEVIPQSKKRVFTKESRALHKIELPTKQPPDMEGKKALFTSSLELTKNAPDALASPIEEVLVPLRETLELHCYHCDKTYHTLSHLNKHIQKHRKCIVCNKMHPSDAVLYDHLREVCYKTVVANPPTLQIERIDENNSIVEKYKETFDFHLKPPMVPDTKPSKQTMLERLLDGVPSANTNVPSADVLCISDDDDDVLIIEDLSAKFNKPSNGESVENEMSFIKSIFRKYKNAVSKSSSSTKVTTSSQTERPENCVKYCNDNQIILENMFGDLAIYKVPLDMLVSQKVSANITYEAKEKEQYAVYKWPTGNVIDLMARRKICPNKNQGGITKSINNLQHKNNDKQCRYLFSRSTDISATTQSTVVSRAINNSVVPSMLTQRNLVQYATQSVLNNSSPAITQNTLISQQINNNIVIANASPAISQPNVSQFANQNMLIDHANAVTHNISQVPNPSVLITSAPQMPQNLIAQSVMNTVAVNNISQFSNSTVATSNTQNALTYTLSQYANQNVSVANFTAPITQSNAVGQESYIMTGSQAYNATLLQNLLDSNVGIQQTNQSYIVPTTTFDASKAITDAPLIILANNSVPTTVSNSSAITSVQLVDVSAEKSLIRVKAPWELNQI